LAKAPLKERERNEGQNAPIYIGRLPVASVQVSEQSYQRLTDILEELNSLPEGISILVEGRKDELSLRKLGIKAPIIHIHSSMSLSELLSPWDEVIILTDYDREGRQLSRRYESAARSLSVKPNTSYRRRIKQATMGEVSHIEGLHTYLIHLKERLFQQGPLG